MCFEGGFGRVYMGVGKGSGSSKMGCRWTYRHDRLCCPCRSHGAASTRLFRGTWLLKHYEGRSLLVSWRLVKER